MGKKCRFLLAFFGFSGIDLIAHNPEGARGALPVADEATRASGSGLYFQGGFDRRRKYRAPQQDVGLSVPSATRKEKVVPIGTAFFFLRHELHKKKTPFLCIIWKIFCYMDNGIIFCYFKDENCWQGRRF